MLNTSSLSSMLLANGLSPSILSRDPRLALQAALMPPGLPGVGGNPLASLNGGAGLLNPLSGIGGNPLAGLSGGSPLDSLLNPLAGIGGSPLSGLSGIPQNQAPAQSPDSGMMEILFLLMNLLNDSEEGDIFGGGGQQAPGQPGQPAQPAAPIQPPPPPKPQGPEKSSIENGSLILSQGALDAIANDPSLENKKKVIKEQIIAAAGTQNPREAVNKLLGTDIKAGKNKDAESAKFFDEIVNKIAESYKVDGNPPAAAQGGQAAQPQDGGQQNQGAQGQNGQQNQDQNKNQMAPK